LPSEVAPCQKSNNYGKTTRCRAPSILILNDGVPALGAGKFFLAKRVYELKKARRQVDGRFAGANCVTLAATARPALFGRVQGAFTGNDADRLRKRLARFGLEWKALRARASTVPD
jgi:sigma54-dependent transcription regulator